MKMKKKKECACFAAGGSGGNRNPTRAPLTDVNNSEPRFEKTRLKMAAVLR